MDSEKERILLANLGFDSMTEFAVAVEKLKAATGMPSRLSEVGLKETDIETVVKNGFRPDRVGNNPRELDAENLTKLLEAVF